MIKLGPKPGSRSRFRHPFPVTIGIDESRMLDLIEKHWRLNRTAVNDDTDTLVAYLARQLDARVVEARADSECLTWRVPLHWRVRKAQLRRKDGTVLCDYADNPLHLWTHSVPFRGEVTREELFQDHILADPGRRDEILYHYRNGYRIDAREWGFSMRCRDVEEMTDPAYDVEIDADLDENGTLKVVDAFLPGECEETILIMAHTCHPALVSDGIGCIAVAAEIYHHLKSLEKRRHSYRFLFGPEYFAAAVWLASAGKEDIGNLYQGMYLDMLTNHEPIGFQHSMQGNARIDRIVKNVLTSHTETHIETPYRELWGNDEMFYNGPGFHVPVIGLGRGMHREYHYDTDNFENIDKYHMVESAWFIMRMIEVFETDYVPVRTFDGPLYLSRYGLYVDPTIAREAARKVERMQALIDGERSVMDIADKLDLDYFFVRDFCDQLAEKGLIEKRPRDPRAGDQGTM